MRAIKFRALVGGKIYKVTQIMYGLGCVEAIKYLADYGAERYTESFTLLQFTGLRDKNGTEIYEGDIVKTNHGNYEVYYDEPTFDLGNGPYGMNYDNGDFYEGFNTSGHPWGEFEVIGNRWENPELLENKE